jgi:hypothetical protein
MAISCCPRSMTLMLPPVPVVRDELSILRPYATTASRSRSICITLYLRSTRRSQPQRRQKRNRVRRVSPAQHTHATSPEFCVHELDSHENRAPSLIFGKAPA